MTTIEQTFARLDDVDIIKIRYLKHRSQSGGATNPPWDAAPHDITRILESDVINFQKWVLPWLAERIKE